MAQRLLDLHKCHAVTAHPALLTELDLGSTIGSNRHCRRELEKADTEAVPCSRE
jgi:hypothetical protein